MKAYFNKYGLEVFLAHDTINPTDEWQTQILKSLKKMDVFIPLLTKEFKKSDWTDQESGYALRKQILIIPIKVDLNPYGFLSKIQAINLRKSNHGYTYNKIIEILHKKTKVKFLNSAINYFGKSEDFESTNQRVKILEQFSDYNIRQLNKILEISTHNSQIYHAFKAEHMLQTLMYIHRNKLNKKLVSNLRKKLSL